MQQRRLTTMAITLALALTAASCGSEDASNTAEPAAESSETTVVAADDEMADDEMADDEMADDEMADDEMADDEMADDGNLVMVASGRDDLTTLVAAIEAAGLSATLADDGPFTIFAPNDEAFLDYLGEMGMSVEDALADATFLSTLLQGHVVAAADDSGMVAGMVDNPFVSLAGTELPVTVDGDTITIGGAEIVQADIFATNGVIHVIGTVLAPA